jgi:hypothetical protein
MLQSPAGRIMLERLHDLAAWRESFAFETAPIRFPSTTRRPQNESPFPKGAVGPNSAF